MSNFACIFAVSVSLALTACQPKLQNDSALKQLKSSFISANKATSPKAMLELYYLEGTDSSTISLLKAALNYELGLEIVSIQFLPLSGAPEETINYTHNGTTYGPTLEAKLRMQVVYKSEDAFTSLFTIGQTPNKKWKIISSKPISHKTTRITVPY